MVCVITTLGITTPWRITPGTTTPQITFHKDNYPIRMITPIRDFQDHARYMEKCAKLACPDKLGVSLFSTLRSTLNPYNMSNMMALKQCETGKKCMDCLLFPDLNHLMTHVSLIF